MPEPTMRDLERLILKLGTGIAKTRSDIARVSAQCAALPLIDARIDELTQGVDHSRELVGHLNQILVGVRSLGDSTYDMQRSTSRKLSVLINALVSAGVISFESLREELETDPHAAPSAETVATATQHPPRG